VIQIVIILIASTLEAPMNAQIYKSPFFSEIKFMQHLHDTQFALQQLRRLAIRELHLHMHIFYICREKRYDGAGG
jgi:hypothetical protein